jgi:CBS domain-containing protein
MYTRTDRDVKRTAHGTSTALLGDVRAAMTTDVTVVGVEEGLGAAARKLEAAGLTGAPVAEDGRVVGVISLDDIHSILPKGVPIAATGPFHRWEPYLDEVARDVSVGDVMHGRSIVVTTDTPLSEAARLMVAQGMTRIPVVDEDHHPVGIVSRQDVVAAVARC